MNPLLCILVLILTIRAVFEGNLKKWNAGGALQKSLIIEWKSASERNKLATCFDLLAPNHPALTLQELHVLSEELKIHIDEAVIDDKSLDNYKVTEIAAMCLVLMEN